MAGQAKKSKKKIIIFGVIGFILVTLIAVAAFSGNKEQIYKVQITEAAKRNITQVVSATGKINPEYQVIITPEVTGEIVELPVKDGQQVKKGQLLIRIKPDTYMANRDRAAANLESTKSGLNVRKAMLDKVKSEYDRIQELYKKELVSDSELEIAKSNYLSAKGEYEAQQSMVLQNEAMLKESNENLSKTAIYSPMDGTVTQLNVELGERVLGSGFSQGTNIMTVADLAKMEATVEVDENDVVLISLNDTAKIKIDAFGDKEFNGVVSEIANSAKTTGLGTQQEVVNFEIKIRLVDITDKIRPGMSCNADIQTETKLDVISVPIQSVTARAPKNDETNNENNDKQEQRKPDNKPRELVFVIKDGKAQSIEVETGISNNDFIEVKSGLSGGEKVVSGPYKAISQELNDNSTVLIENDQKKKTNKS